MFPNILRVNMLLKFPSGRREEKQMQRLPLKVPQSHQDLLWASSPTSVWEFKKHALGNCSLLLSYGLSTISFPVATCDEGNEGRVYQIVWSSGCML